MICVQELNIDISVSSGGLDQFLDAVPLNVEEGGMAVMQLNTTGVVSFLAAHADLETAPVILIQLLTSPQHGELRVQDDGNTTSFTQQQVDAGEVRSYARPPLPSVVRNSRIFFRKTKDRHIEPSDPSSAVEAPILYA